MRRFLSSILPAWMILGFSIAAPEPALAERVFFSRGDSNADGGIDITDPLHTLTIIFLDATPPPCREACDSNDDGAVDVSDPVYTLTFLFLGGDPPPPPFPGCGIATGHDLGCGTFPPCAGGFLVNAQVDAERQDAAQLRDMVKVLEDRGIRTTIYVSADFANREAPLVEELFAKGFEIALHGYYTGEQLATMTYEEQKDLLSRAKKAVEGCAPCGTFKPVIGFRPQYFSQNEDTFRVLDELGLTYDGGFKVHQIYLPGHEADTTPYKAEGHGFYAVPVTTVEYNGKEIYLCDMACGLSEMMTGAQWAEAVRSGLQRSSETKEPLVLLLHAWYTGDKVLYDYWQPFLDFLDETRARHGAFVTTEQLTALYAE